MIQTRESALCKLRKKHRSKKLKEDCQLDRNPLIQSLSSFDRNSVHGPKDRMWNSKEKVLTDSILKCSPRSYAFLEFLFPQPSRRTLHSLLNTGK